MDEDDVLVAIHVPISQTSDQYFIRSYKPARRRRNDSKGIISAGLCVHLEPSDSIHNCWRICSACFSFGGMASATVMAKNTQRELVGQLWTKSTLDNPCKMILKEMPL